MDDFVMAAAATEIASPALAARLLAVHVAIRQPYKAPGGVHALLERSHRTAVVTDKAMARREIAVR